MERSRDRYTFEEVETASQILGFGSEGPLKVEYDNDIPEEFIENAWRECVKRSWRDHDGGQNLQRDANEALRILAEAKGSVRLRSTWEAGKDKLTNPDRAYDILEVPKELDDSMLIPVFSMRVCDFIML
jgi:ubiquitin carboxyl-terminal hydrolase 25/28